MKRWTLYVHNANFRMCMLAGTQFRQPVWRYRTKPHNNIIILITSFYVSQQRQISRYSGTVNTWVVSRSKNDLNNRIFTLKCLASCCCCCCCCCCRLQYCYNQSIDDNNHNNKNNTKCLFRVLEWAFIPDRLNILTSQKMSARKT